MIWAYEVMARFGDLFAYRIPTVDVPRCVRWNFVTTFSGVTDDELYFQFDDAALGILIIVPDSTELEEVYYISIHLANILVAKFHVPSDSYITVERHIGRQEVLDHENFVDVLNVAPQQRWSTRSRRFIGNLSEEGVSSSCQTRSSSSAAGSEGVPSEMSKEKLVSIIREELTCER